MSDDNEHMWQQVQDAVADERQRCIALCMMRASISRQSAQTLLERTRSGARTAKDLEALAVAFEVVADCIAKGHDPRKSPPDPNAKIDIRPGRGDCLENGCPFPKCDC